jgi:uncharacterized RDD family membrane protein YckC
MELATRKQRFGAAILDGVVVGIPYAIGSFEATPAPLRVVAVLASLGLLVYQLRLVSMTGQTIGKRWVGIRIVLKEGLVNGGFVTNVVKRGLVNGLLSLIPVYFLVDCCFIFREDRRCIHDLIAGTCVIQAEPDVVQ